MTSQEMGDLEAVGARFAARARCGVEGIAGRWRSFSVVLVEFWDEWKSLGGADEALGLACHWVAILRLSLRLFSALIGQPNTQGPWSASLG